MSETSKPVFQINQQLFQQLVEWQEKLELEDESEADSEDKKLTQVKKSTDSQEESSKTDNSQFLTVLINGEAMETLKLAMLEAETAPQLAALIIDYTHEEMMIIFSELEWEQQDRIKTIWKTAVDYD